jgi:alpha-L-fucosidase
MTMNDSWGYQKADDDWKTPKAIVKNLITCSRDTGNYLLNIGPKPDGSIPEESVKIMTQVGKWMSANGKTIYETEVCQPRRSNYATFTRKGNTLYMHVHFWPGDTVSLGGLMNKVQSARLFAGGKPVKFEQEKFRVRFFGLPEKAPDDPVTTLAIECDGEPRQDTDFVRKERPREKA